MRINDENTLEDILGLIAFAAGREAWPAEVDQRVIDEIVARIDAKLRHDRNVVRKNWFSIARAHAANAVECFKGGDFRQFEEELRQAEEHLRQGNRAGRRKLDYCVGPNGEAERL